MLLKVFPDKISMGQAAADQAAPALRRALVAQGHARIIAATGSAQFEFLAALAKEQGIDWTKVEGFHLDEYIGLAATHPASFCKILQERLVSPNGIGNFHFIEGDAADPSAVVRELGKQIASAPIDIAFLGIGENAHLAFNDPPADFAIEDPYLIVKLDEACRRQQVGEGWFADLSQVPTHAISMSVRQILKAKELLAVVPDQRKAEAVRACIEGEISPMVPASILRTHPNVTVYLDTHSASLLSPALQAALKADSKVVVGS
jgi:glucosamine-6-phosphate deaminase